MIIKPLSGDADLSALLPVYRAAYGLALPDMPAPADRVIRWQMAAPPRYETAFYGAFPDADDQVAAGYVGLSYGLDDNPDVAYAKLCVAPERRRAGTGTALLDTARFASLELGRTLLAVDGLLSPALEGFAARHGARPVDDAVRSVFDLTAFDHEAFGAHAAPSPANNAYRIVRWVGACPDELLESFTRTFQSLDDTPTGESGYEFPQFSAELTRAYEGYSAAFGLTRYVVAALAGDDVVAFTSVHDSGPDAPVGLVDDTMVAGAHRGHRLGLRLKAASALWLREAAPHLTMLQTWNDAGNVHMIAVNRALGWQPSDTWRMYHIDLEAAP